MDDALSSALDHSDDEEEQDAVINQVLDEIGIEITGKVRFVLQCDVRLLIVFDFRQLANAPSAGRDSLGATASKQNNKLTDSDLEAQLAKLKM